MLLLLLPVYTLYRLQGRNRASVTRVCGVRAEGSAKLSAGAGSLPYPHADSATMCVLTIRLVVVRTVCETYFLLFGPLYILFDMIVYTVVHGGVPYVF